MQPLSGVSRIHAWRLQCDGSLHATDAVACLCMKVNGHSVDFDANSHILYPYIIERSVIGSVFVLRRLSGHRHILLPKG